MVRHRDAYDPLLAGIAAEGGSVDAFLRAAGADPDAPVGSPPPEVVAGRLVAAAVAAFGPGFAVRTAARRRLEDHGALGWACLTAATVGEALDRGLRWRRVRFDRDDYRLDVRGDVVALVRADPDGDDVVRRFVVELGLAEHLVALREVADERLVPLAVTFALPPTDVAELEGFFGVRPTFGAEHALVIPRAWLDRPARHAHPGLARHFAREVEGLLARLPPDAPTTRRLRELLPGLLASGTPSAPDVARKMGMSDRTLARRLAEEGTTFGDVLDDVRRDRAVRWLEDGREIADVAFLLGFSDASAFGRAFKRWTGRTPASFRQ